MQAFRNRGVIQFLQGVLKGGSVASGWLAFLSTQRDMGFLSLCRVGQGTSYRFRTFSEPAVVTVKPLRGQWREMKAYFDPVRLCSFMQFLSTPFKIGRWA